MPYLYEPPTWRNPVLMGGALIPGIATSTAVWRQGGAWSNAETAGMDNPVVAECDIEPTTGLLLFFTGPVVVPDSLAAELADLQPASAAWTPGVLTAL